MMKKIKNIKLLVFDIDGTILIQGNETITSKVKQALKLAEENGYKVMIATGRHYNFIPKILLEDVNPNYLVTINGGSLVDKKGKVIEQYPMDQNELERLVEECYKNKIAIALKCKDDIVVYTYFLQYVEGYVGLDSPFAKLLVDDTKHRDYHLRVGPALGGFLIGDHPTIYEIAKKFPSLEFARSHSVGFDVYMNNTNKATTIESFLNYQGMTWENVMAFGDAGNDIDMIKRAAIGVALGNSSKYVKEHADYITDTVDNEGVVKALKHFEII